MTAWLLLLYGLTAVSAGSFYHPNQTLAFGVDPSEGHDDFLMSLALVLAAATGAAPRRARGRSSSL